MNLNFVPKEADKAYVSNALWLPKSGIRTEPVKNALEFLLPGKDGPQTIAMWEESAHHIIVPREFIPPSDYKNYKFPFVDLRPQFQKVEFRDSVVPRDEAQLRALEALQKNDNGILNLACGKGKTKLSLKKVAQRGVPTLIVVPDGGILTQWQVAIRGDKNSPPSLEFDGELGLIQGPVFNWAKPVTLALLPTLSMRIRDGHVPEEMFRYFGLIIYDEAHVMSAPMFSLAAPPFYGDRLGLTATVKRDDGTDPIFRYHIGEPFYSDLSQDLVPRIYFQKTPTTVKYEEAKRNGTTNISVLRTMVGRDFKSNVFRYWCIDQALGEGRKLLVLSHSKDQLKLFHAMFPGSGLITQETPQNDRMEILRTTNPCFAVSKLGSTGVDDDQLDTLFWLTPSKALIPLQQGMGRIQRVRPGKKTPVMVVFEDSAIPSFKKLCQSWKGTLREWNYQFDSVNAQKLPDHLPPDVQAAYDAVFAALPERGYSENDED